MRKSLILLLLFPFSLFGQTCETIFPSLYADSIQYCITDASCHDSCDGSIVINVFGPNHPYSFEWNNSNISTPWDNSRTNLCASSHIVTITDVNGDLVDNSHINTVEEPTNFSVFEVITHPSCFNYSDGSIDLTISGSVPFFNTPSYILNWDDGPTTEDRSSLDSGIYMLTISDANGCVRIDTFELLNPNEVNSTTISDTLSCIGSCDGEAVVLPNSGFSPYIFLWSDGQTTDTAINLCYGSYSVFITDSNGCLDTNSVFIDNPDTLMLSNLMIDSACYQICDGEISVSVQGGSSPYEISWSAGGLVFDTLSTTINQLCPDMYKLVYTDANNCSDSININLLERDSFNLSSSVIDDSCFNSCTGEISVQLLNPNSPPFIYDWSNGVSSSVVSNLCADSINLELIDAGGCRDTFYFFVNEPPVLSFDSVSVTHNVCYGDQNGAIAVNISGGTGTVSTLWTGINNFSSTDEDIANLISSTYSLHIEDQNLCARDTIFTITQPDSLIAVHSVQNASCYGYSDGIVDVTIQGGISPYSISWDVLLSDSTTIDFLAAGDYIYYITDSNGCNLSDTTTVNQPDLLVISDSIIDVLCHGYHSGSVDLTISGGTQPYSYQWDNNETTQDLNNIGSNTYTVVVTDLNGCSESENYTISEPFFPLTANVIGTNVLCYGDNTGIADLSVSGGTFPYLFSWNTAATTEDINDLVAGNYTVTIIDDHGCDTTSSIDILENAQISTNYTIGDVLCNGDSTGSINLISTIGGTSPYTYDCSNGFSSNSPTVIYVDAGQYSILVTDVNLCTENLQFIVSEPDSLSVTSSTTNVSCYGYNDGTATINPIGGTGTLIIDWFGMSYNALPPGTHPYTITDSNGCILSSSVMITEPSLMTTSSTYSESLCYGDNNGSITVIAAGGMPPYQYSIDGTTSQSTGLFSGLEVGVYTVSIIDGNTCSQIESFNITEPLAIQAYFDVIDVMCFGESTGSIDLTVNGGTPNPDYIYAWSNSVNTQDVNNLFAGDYSVSVTDANNCTESFDVSLTEPEELVLIYTVYDATCEENNDGSIITNVSGGTIPYTYLWSNGLDDADLMSLSKGLYSLEIRDDHDCIYQIGTIEVGFEGYDGCIEIPSGFTPNGDGIHDEWAIYGLYNFPDVVVDVFNRWGQQVFYSEGYNVPWDGRSNGIELPIATYYYVIELQDSGKVFNGTVTIKR